MSKGALNSMQHGLIEPLAAKGIRINTVSPGVTETDMVSICVEINQCVRINAVKFDFHTGINHHGQPGAPEEERVRHPHGQARETGRNRRRRVLPAVPRRVLHARRQYQE